MRRGETTPTGGGCRRVGGLDKVVDGLSEVIDSLVKISPHVIGVLNWRCTPAIIVMWAICHIGPPVIVDGTYWTTDFSPVFIIKQI